MPHPSSKDGRGGLKAATVEGGAASGEAAERKKENHYKKLFHVPVGGMLPIIMETGGRLTEKTRRALSSYIRRDIMGVEDEDKWTPSCQVQRLLEGTNRRHGCRSREAGGWNAPG